MRERVGTFLLAAAGIVLAHGANAQATSGSFVGTAPDRPGCPSVTFHIIRSGSALSGVVFYTNGSGVSTIKGEVEDGKISWKQTPTAGNGPSGEVNGTISDLGAMKLNLTGTSCRFQATLPLIPTYSTASGG